MTIVSYRDLEVWKQAMRLAHLAYDCTNLFPPIERYVLLPKSVARRCRYRVTSRRVAGAHIPASF